MLSTLTFQISTNNNETTNKECLVFLNIYHNNKTFTFPYKLSTKINLILVKITSALFIVFCFLLLSILHTQHTLKQDLTLKQAETQL